MYGIYSVLLQTALFRIILKSEYKEFWSILPSAGLALDRVGISQLIIRRTKELVALNVSIKHNKIKSQCG